MPSAARRPQRPFQAIAYASPLKTARRGSSRPAKRQKIAVSPTKSRSENSQSNYGDEDDPIILSDSTSESENDGRPLFSHRGAAVSNRGKAKQSKAPKGKGVEFRLKKQRSRNFAQYATSPRKRKRDVWDEQGVDPDADAHPDDDDDDDDDFESYDGSSSVRSLQEHPIQEDPELEPVFMKDDDDYMLHQAPGNQLNRLRKAELVRLWKVAGIWEGETDSIESEHIGDEQEDYRKSQLIEGILEARNSTSSYIQDKLPVGSSSYNASVDMLRLYSTPNSESYTTPQPTTDEDQSDPANRTRNLLRSRTYAAFGPGKENEDVPQNAKKRYSATAAAPRNRRARFRESVQSPPEPSHARQRDRRASLASSAASSTQQYSRPPSVSRLRSGALTRRHSEHQRSVSFATTKGTIQVEDADMADWDEDAVEDASESGEDEDYKLEDSRTPNVRLRKNQVEADADDEREAETPKRRNLNNLSFALRHTPARKAKKRAMKAIKAVDASETGDAEMLEDGSDHPTDSGDSDDDPTPKHPFPLTRARRNSEQATTVVPTPISRRLRHSRDAMQIPSPSTEEDGEDGMTDEDIEDDVDAFDDESVEIESPTRSRNGRSAPLRTLRSQVKHGNVNRNGSLEMRLEDMDLDESIDDVIVIDSDEDVEMADQVSSSQQQEPGSSTSDTNEVAGMSDVDDEDEDDDDEDGGDEAGEDDLSFANATPATLIRLRKADLMQMCESRDLCTDGTKQQLVEALIEWREATDKGSPVPSSASTAKPQSGQPTASAIAGDAANSAATAIPVLLREHVHANDPVTPPYSEAAAAEAADADVVLDLEELGLIDKEIPASQVTKGDKIGSGGYKDVYMGKLRGRAKVAICEFRDEMSDMDIRELKLLAEFNHPNIVRLLGVAIPDKSTGTPCMVITELCENGDLFDYIRNVPAPSFAKVLKLMINIAEGLEYLHERKPRVIHRDCKSTNILINRKGVAKVGDFGLARVKSTTRSVIRSLVGTVNWQAPELWHPKPRYDYKVDVFSCAMVFWEMLNGWANEKKTYPWEGRNEHWIYDAVGTKKQRPPVTNLRKHWGTDVVDLMERMWNHDPAERPTMTDVLDDLKAILDNSLKK